MLTVDQLDKDDPRLHECAPEMLNILFSISAMLFSDGPLYVAKLPEAGPWTLDEKARYLYLMERTVALISRIFGESMPAGLGEIQ